MIIYNNLALLTALIGVLGGGVSLLFVPTSATGFLRYLPMMCTGLVTAIADIWVRRRNSPSKDETLWFHFEAGGQIWFIPMWIIGGALAIFAVAASFARDEAGQGIHGAPAESRSASSSTQSGALKHAGSRTDDTRFEVSQAFHAKPPLDTAVLVGVVRKGTVWKGDLLVPLKGPSDSAVRVEKIEVLSKGASNSAKEGEQVALHIRPGDPKAIHVGLVLRNRVQ